MQPAILFAAALAASLLLPRAASAFEADNAGAPAGAASFADPDVTLGLESPDEGDTPAEAPSLSIMFGGALQSYGTVSAPTESDGASIPGRLP